MEATEAAGMDSSREKCSHADLEPGNRKRACMASLKTEIEEILQVQIRATDRFPTIWRVHPQLRNQDPEAYEPKAISIGPLHHGKKGLIPMEKMKLEILGRILLGQEENTLEILYDEVFQCLGGAREEYSEKIELPDEVFAKMLMIDACFVIAFCSLDTGFAIIELSVWAFQLVSISQYLYKDLWLLENQIPFFVVNKLFQKFCVIFPKFGDAFPNCTSLLLQGMKIYIPPEKYPREENVRHLLHLLNLSKKPFLLLDEPCPESLSQRAMLPMKKLAHLLALPFLGMFYLTLLCDCSGLFGNHRKTQNHGVIRTATELQEAGVKFQMKVTPKEYYDTACQLKVSWREGTLEIPQLSITNSTYLEMKNLIAFEQSTHFLISSHVTHYWFLLDELVNTPEDVAILRRSGILENTLGSDAEVAEMVNSFCKGVFMPGNVDPYDKIREDLQQFCVSLTTGGVRVWFRSTSKARGQSSPWWLQLSC